jgi:hypothetical protein
MEDWKSNKINNLEEKNLPDLRCLKRALRLYNALLTSLTARRT